MSEQKTIEASKMPHTPVPSPDAPFMPTHPAKRSLGYRGFYPAPAKVSIAGSPPGSLPLPLKCVTTVPGIKSIRARIMFHAADMCTGRDAVFHNMVVVWTPAELIRNLFCRTGISVDSFMIETDDRHLMFAQWRQDTQSGAFAVWAGGEFVITQGGFKGHMPEGVEWTDGFDGHRWDNWSYRGGTVGVSTFNQ